MALKLKERGRGKYKPNPDSTLKDVKELLTQKIEEEMKLIIDEPDTYSFDDLTYMKNKANITSLFSGAGGLDLGVELAGIDCIIGENETNKAYKNIKKFNEIREQGIFHHLYANDNFTEALETYQLNFTDTVLSHKKDIKKVKTFPMAEIIVGGPPCPGYSASGPRLIDDPRNFLYLHYIRALMQVQPKFFIFENVKGMMNLGKGEVFRQIKQDLEASGYRIYHKLVNARDYGIPQLRERVFIIGVRKDIEFEYLFPNPTHGKDDNLKPFVTLEDAIGDLKNNPGEIFEGSFSPMYMSRNRKKEWTEQSFTIQASGRQAPLHPSGLPMEKVDKDFWKFQDKEKNNRRLSIKEIARIQTFPDWFQFSYGKKEGINKNGRLNKVYKQIGNAVPVELARIIARPIAEYIKDAQ